METGFITFKRIPGAGKFRQFAAAPKLTGETAMYPLPDDLSMTVQNALAEDIRDGDISAQLIGADETAQARVTSRDNGVLCGTAWFDEVFHQLDPDMEIIWQARDGEEIFHGQLLCTLSGHARSLLSGERSALNFLQTLSGTASKVKTYCKKIAHTKTQLLDTRKTLPGLRNAQKYAVLCGGGHNHRKGLYDAFLIKENHIHALGSLTRAVEAAHRMHPDKPVETEVENLEQLEEALQAGVGRILLDNFKPDELRKAVEITQGRAKLEASGGITLDSLGEIAETGVDYISSGALTKNVRALDLSMRFIAV